MQALLLPATFMNPLPPVAARAREAPPPTPSSPPPEAEPSRVPASTTAPGLFEGFMQGLKHDARQGALTVGESAGLATAPVGKGLSEMAGFLSHASDNANAIASKVFAGELVLAGVAIVGIIAAVFLATGNRPVAKMLEGRRIRSEAD